MSKYLSYMIIINCTLLGVLAAKDTNGQTVSVNDVFLTIDLENADLHEVFSSIEEQTGFTFTYFKSNIKKKQISKIQENNTSLAKVLRQISREADVQFKRVNENIYVNKKDGRSTEWMEVIGDNVADIDINGKITDENGAGLPGASVLVKGTTQGTTSDIEGNYSLSAPEDAVLVISFVGYVSLEMEVANRSTIDVQMQPDAEQLEEIVVIGYGTQKKSDLTGAVNSVNTDEVRKIAAVTVGQALQGRAPGVTVTSRSGAPGSEPTIKIRGFGTINNSNPYVIVDGVPGSLNDLNSADIQSIEVLKDASATAIYGSNGANGVILVTTKTGKSGQLKVNIDSYVGVQNKWRDLDMLNSQEWAMINNEGAVNDGGTAIFTDAEIAAMDTYDWGNLLYRTGKIQNHQVSVSGGNENINYLLSYGLTDQTGLLKGSDFQRQNIRLNTEYTVNKNVMVGIRASYAKSDRTTRRESSRWLWSQSAIQGYGWEPFIPFYDANGGFSEPQRVSAIHPEAELAFETNQSTNRSFGLNAYVEASFLNDFTFRTTYAPGFSTDERYDFDDLTDPLGIGYAANGGIDRVQNQLTSRVNRSSSYTWSNVLTYSKILGDAHNITAMVGHEQQESTWIGTTAIARGLSDLFNGNGTISSSSDVGGEGGRSEEALHSYFARLLYSYAGRYSVTATVRDDGSTKFGPGKKTGIFPAVAVAWNAHNEAFLSSSPALSLLKLRVGRGEIGNRNIANYSFYSRLAVGPTSGVDAVIGGQRASGAATKSVFNPNLAWESTMTTNIGIDLGFLSDKFTLSVDYFDRETSGMIISVNPVTETTGLSQSTLFNVGGLNNRGWEIAAGYDAQIGELSLRVDAYVDVIKNKVGDLNERIFGDGDAFGQNGFLRTEEGEPMSYFYGYQTDGIFQNTSEVAEGNQPDALPGDIRFVDFNDDGQINGDDRTKIGSPHPDFNYSFNIGADYKGFDLTMFWQGVQGNDIFSSMPYFFENELASGLQRSALDRWHGEGTSTTVPRATFTGAATNNVVSDRYVYDGSYLRLKNLQIGYNLPSEMLDKIRIERLRFYISGQNLLTFTGYDIGFDPEIGQSPSEGNQRYIGQDRGTYPQPRTFLFGLNLTF